MVAVAESSRFLFQVENVVVALWRDWDFADMYVAYGDGVCAFHLQCEVFQLDVDKPFFRKLYGDSGRHGRSGEVVHGNYQVVRIIMCRVLGLCTKPYAAGGECCE